MTEKAEAVPFSIVEVDEVEKPKQSDGPPAKRKRTDEEIIQEKKKELEDELKEFELELRLSKALDCERSEVYETFNNQADEFFNSARIYELTMKLFVESMVEKGCKLDDLECYIDRYGHDMEMEIETPLSLSFPDNLRKSKKD